MPVDIPTCEMEKITREIKEREAALSDEEKAKRAADIAAIQAATQAKIERVRAGSGLAISTTNADIAAGTVYGIGPNDKLGMFCPETGREYSRV